MKHTQRTISTQVTYEVNGVRYKRLDDVPPEHRAFFEDKNRNGIPDFIEKIQDGSGTTLRCSMRLVGGKELPVGDLRADSASATNAAFDTIACLNCGYDLRGTAVGGKCPECGHSVARSLQPVMLPRSRRGEILHLILCSPAFWMGLVSFAAIGAILIFLARLLRTI